MASLCSHFLWGRVICHPDWEKKWSIPWWMSSSHYHGIAVGQATGSSRSKLKLSLSWFFVLFCFFLPFWLWESKPRTVLFLLHDVWWTLFADLYSGLRSKWRETASVGQHVSQWEALASPEWWFGMYICPKVRYPGPSGAWARDWFSTRECANAVCEMYGLSKWLIGVLAFDVGFEPNPRSS